MAKNNPKMVQFDPDKWTPTKLVAPDGREWTASSAAEEKNLLAAHGYRKVEGTKGSKGARPTGGATPPDAK